MDRQTERLTFACSTSFERAIPSPHETFLATQTPLAKELTRRPRDLREANRAAQVLMSSGHQLIESQVVNDDDDDDGDELARSADCLPTRQLFTCSSQYVAHHH